MNQDLQDQIDAMQVEIESLKTSNSIPYSTENAFKNRGFLTTPTLMISGATIISATGNTLVSIKNNNKNAIAFANYVDGSASVVGVALVNSGRTLSLTGTATKLVNYIVFINANNNIIVRTFTFTVTIASPGIFTANGHGLIVGNTVFLSTTGALPTGLTAGVGYYVISTGLTTNTFELSATPGGSAITTSGTQSGVHTLTVYEFN